MTLANIGEMLREILAAVKGAPALANDLAASRVEAADLKTKLSATEAERDSLKSKLADKEGEAAAARAEADKHAADVKAANDEAYALARAIVDAAQTEELSTHVAVSFDESDAGRLLHMAEAVLRAGPATASGSVESGDASK